MKSELFRSRHIAILSLLLIGLVIVSIYFGMSLSLSPGQVAYFLLGIIAAIFANSTGAGGGVVFIPMFHLLGFNEMETVATSFGIQCFGMTAGAITWSIFYKKKDPEQRRPWQCFTAIAVVASICSALGIWTNYYFQIPPPAALQAIFSIFSILLGLSILATIYIRRSSSVQYEATLPDYAVIILITYVGGIITAWLSVGVGEIIAFYLIFRRFDVTMAVAIGVVVTAATVWSAAPQHFLLNQDLNWQVLAFAGPGAVIGGITARRLVGMLSARRLKIFFGVWVLIIGLAAQI